MQLDLIGPQIKRALMGLTVRRLFEGVGLLLSLFALAFAVDQFLEERKQEKAFDKQQQQLQRIALDVTGAAEAASTRSVGNFPITLPAITQVVKSTCDKLVIMADVPGYGMYSNPDGFNKYLLAIEEVASMTREEARRSSACIGVPTAGNQQDGKIDVQMVLYDREQLQKTLENQFKEASYPQTVADQKFNRFFDRHRELKRPENYQQFIAALVQGHLNVAAELSSHQVHIKYANRRYMIYFWMHDEAETAFSLDYQGDVEDDLEKELTFRSRDGKMTSALAAIFGLEWRKAL
jgi:hypothetical protein